MRIALIIIALFTAFQIGLEVQSIYSKRAVRQYVQWYVDQREQFCFNGDQWGDFESDLLDNL